MVVFDLSKTKKLNEVCDIFNTLETEQDFKEFYRQYYSVTEEAVIKNKGIEWGNKRPIAESLSVVNSNMVWILDNANQMRRDFARKVFWFLV